MRPASDVNEVDGRTTYAKAEGIHSRDTYALFSALLQISKVLSKLFYFYKILSYRKFMMLAHSFLT